MLKKYKHSVKSYEALLINVSFKGIPQEPAPHALQSFVIEWVLAFEIADEYNFLPQRGLQKNCKYL